ncbi:MAG: TetR/AcrR family transcriptional regulator [Sphaerochaetaceae bacterium]|nr:TetR/AcrR family transcriptional regulator [Sphaerochaetaceae bacterium]
MKTKYAASYFTEALFELLREKHYEEISIVDIVRKSGCSKASFYRNFSSKDQIIDNYLMTNIYPIINRNLTKDHLKQELTMMFSELFRSRQQLSLLDKANLLNRLDKVFLISSIAEINTHNPTNTKYAPYYYAGATSSFIKAWISFDFAESAEEVAGIFLESLIIPDTHDIK